MLTCIRCRCYVPAYSFVQELGQAVRTGDNVCDAESRRRQQHRPVVDTVGLNVRTYSVRGAEFTFFFQAEDGIRDVAVTGVQTCALPISRAPAAGRAAG